MVEMISLFKDLISKDNLIRAWDHVRYDAENDFAPDCLDYDDIGANLKEVIKTIHNKLSSNNYQALPVKDVDVPKSSLAVRPGSVPEIEDRLVSYAIINVIAPKIDEKISKNVYSFRVRKDYRTSKKGLFEEREDIPYLKKKTLQRIALIEDWFYEWPAFYEVSKYLYEEEGYKFLSVSDVSSYYENINHEILRDHLLSYLIDEQKTVNLLMDVLNGWVWRSGKLRKLGRGIPQGNDASSFLGNIFLMPLDEKFEEYSKSNDIKYIRYMDDVKIFSKSEDVARDVLFTMNKALRDLYLNVQGFKTQIHKGEEIEEELFPKGMDALNATIDAMGKVELTPEEKSGFEKKLKTHFARIYRKRKWGKHEWRLFSRLLTGFKLVGSEAAVGRCISEIRSNPDAGINAKIISYLRLFPTNERVINELGKFLLSKINKFDYQEAHLFLLYRYLEVIPVEVLDYMYKVAFDEGKHWFNRCAAFVAIGSTKLGYKTLDKLRKFYDEETNADVKRAISLCLIQTH